MITEFALATGIVYTANKITNWQEKNKWKTRAIKPYAKVFEGFCVVNDVNFSLEKGVITPFGASLTVSLKNETFSVLEKLIERLEIAFETGVAIVQDDVKWTATLDIFRYKLNDKYNKFKPVKTEPYELYLGMNIRFEEMIVDMTEYPHFLDSGSTGTGKSEYIKMVVANLIKFHTEKYINIHICNIGFTGDFDDFIDCKQVKSLTEDIKGIEEQYEYLLHLYEKRVSLFRKYKVKNIRQYNEKFKGTGREMPYVYLVVDEIESLHPDSGATGDKDRKSDLYDILTNMSGRVRKSGIFLILGLQRPSKTVFSPEIKKNMGVRAAFRQNNKSSSIVAIDSEKAVDLDKRYFILQYGIKEHVGRSLYVTDDMIKETIKDSLVPDRTELPDFNCFSEDASPKEDRGKPKEINNEKRCAIRKKEKPVSIDLGRELGKDKASRVKNVEVIENVKYVVEEGKILTRTINKIN